MASIFFVCYIYSYYGNSEINKGVIYLILTIFFVYIRFFSPRKSQYLYDQWMKLGVCLSRYISPLTLGFIFFVLITPVASFARFIGRDQLRLKRESVSSYWIDRLPTGPDSNSFKNQF